VPRIQEVFFRQNNGPVTDLAQFHALVMSAASPGRELDVTLNPDRTFSLTLAGDFNRDGIVDAADYVVWRKGLGTTHTPGDFNLWRDNFGTTFGSGSGAAIRALSDDAVPEPESIFLMALGALALTCVCRLSSR